MARDPKPYTLNLKKGTPNVPLMMFAQRAWAAPASQVREQSLGLSGCDLGLRVSIVEERREREGEREREREREERERKERERERAREREREEREREREGGEFSCSVWAGFGVEFLKGSLAV